MSPSNETLSAVEGSETVEGSEHRTALGAFFEKCRTFGRHVASRWTACLAGLFDGTVRLGADWVAAVLSQPKVQDAVVGVIVRAINAFMEQDDLGGKMDRTARSVLYDKDRRKDAAREVGKEVVPLVTGFFGGVASSLKPGTKKGKSKKSGSFGEMDSDETRGSSSTIATPDNKKDS